MDRSAEVSQHASFDRRPYARARLPATTHKKFLASYRTAYTTLVCIILTHYWKLGGTATYVAPLLSAISGGSAYFGQWQNDAWKVTYAAFIGGALGIAIGYSWQYNYYQITLLFIVLTWANRISLWDRLGKVISAIGIVLGTLWPTLSRGVIIGLEPFKYTVLIVCIPYAITGVTLLFPRLTLASFAAEDKVSKICTTLNSAVSALVRGFCAADYADLYTAEIDHLVVQLEKDLDELTVLKSFVESEALVFHKLQPFGPALEKFIQAVRLIVDEISSVRDNLDSLLHNRTQAKFVEILRPILGNLGADIEIVICIAEEHLTSAYNVRIYPTFVYTAWEALNSVVELFFDCLLNCRMPSNSSQYSQESRVSSPQRMSSRKEAIDESYQATATRYFDSTSKSIKMKSMNDRRNFFKVSPRLEDEEVENLMFQANRERERDGEVDLEKGPTALRGNSEVSAQSEAFCRKKELRQTIQRLKASQSEMIDLYRRARAQYVWHSSYTFTGAKEKIIEEDEAIAAAVFQETKLLSFRNLGPRAAILHRTSLLTELICSLDSVINTEKDNTAFKVTYLSSLSSFCLRALLTIFTYFKEVSIACTGNIMYISTIVIPALLACPKSQANSRSSSESPLPSVISPSAADENETRKGVPVTELSLKVVDQVKSKPIKPSRNSVSLERAEVLIIIKKSLLEVRNTYSQPAKIALAVTVTSFFALLQQLSDSSQNSLWAILVVILVRQENTSSSFLTGYQRLEGTVVGAVYAFTMFQIFGCATSKCGSEISTPVLVIWLAICSFFRDGPRHGYAAIVAGFTPIVLFLGNTPSTADGAWMRVEMTFIGIGIYLIIDNLILPNRTDVALRAGVLKSIEETRAVMTESFAAVRVLMTIGTDPKNKEGDRDGNVSPYSPEGSVELEDIDAEIRRRNSVYSMDEKIMSQKDFKEEMKEDIRTSVKRNNSEKDSPKSTDFQITDSPRPHLPRTPSYPRNEGDVLLNFKEKIEFCNVHLTSCAKSVGRLKALVVKDLLNLSLVVHEPELWQRSFPAEVYKPLLTCFDTVMKTTRSVASATKSFSGVLQDMVSRGEGEAVALHLSTYSFMTKHLLAVSDKTDRALQLVAETDGAQEPLEMLTDLTAIVTLSRGCEALQQSVDDYYRQDVYHSVSAATKSLSHLGIALRAVRDVEALSAL